MRIVVVSEASGLCREDLQRVAGELGVAPSAFIAYVVNSAIAEVLDGSASGLQLREQVQVFAKQMEGGAE